MRSGFPAKHQSRSIGFFESHDIARVSKRAKSVVPEAWKAWGETIVLSG